MALTEAQRRANDKYIKENYKRLAVSYPNDFVEAVKKAAEDRGMSLASFVREAIVAKMEEREG